MKIKRDDKAEKFLKALMLGAASLSFVLTVSITLRVTIDDEDNTNIESSSIVETTTGTTSTTLTTTTTTSTTTSTTLTSTTTTTITTTETTTTTTEVTSLSQHMKFIGNFTGKYYHGEYSNPCLGGSGRMLDDCGAYHPGEIRGSVACRYIQETYGYDINGRTRIYIESDIHPEINGFYYVDDACQAYDVVDFYYIDYGTCPWQEIGNLPISVYMEIG